ncbi:DUF1742-domain-containing protein [Hygrophoropsis aurantiaca]|uniref:DUF1742-domain-containing protein n=1 Tax=Hygrophoropsis aurantiaca TaxID=72124 RepID=A0ACB8ATT4_9AGAM|nr:DUF1742-domain-containing protein [Hygrophoropsis aurantiaca]
MSFPNIYYKRTAATAKACFICYKPSTTVLATVDTTDFLYTCPTHLGDYGFASRLAEPEQEPKKPGATPEEIAKVKEEWEERQRRKKEKAKEAAEKDEKAKSEDKDKDKGAKKEDEDKDADKKSPSPPGSWSSGQSTPASKPVHERYALHRDIFALRVAEHRKRRHASQAKELAPRLPGAPRSVLP